MPSSSDCQLNFGPDMDGLLLCGELKIDGRFGAGLHFHLFLNRDRFSEEEPLGHFLASHVESGFLARHLPAFVPGGDLILPRAARWST